MWQLKTSVIAIVVGELGLVKKGTAKHFEKIHGKQNLAETQKIVLISTTHTSIKALSIYATKLLDKKEDKIFNDLLTYVNIDFHTVTYFLLYLTIITS